MLKEIALSHDVMAIVIKSGMDVSNASMAWVKNMYNPGYRLCTMETYNDLRIVDITNIFLGSTYMTKFFL